MARTKQPPGEADKPDGTPGAKDGQPDADELARRRTARGGTSASERAAAGDDDDAGAELSPHGSLEGDPKVTLKSLIKAGARVSVKASISSAEVPIKGGGLFDP